MTKPFQAKKFFSRVGRRNLIILSAVLLIGVAVYLNYLWFYNDSSIGYGDNNMVDNLGQGDDQSAGADGVTDESDYFAAAVLARQQARDEAMEVLQSVVDASGEDTQERVDALAELSKIAVTMEDEANIESLILSKGFEQCVAVISGNRASIIVSSEGELTAAQNAQICTIVYETAEILPQNVTISCK